MASGCKVSSGGETAVSKRRCASRSTYGGTRSISSSCKNYEGVNLAKWSDFCRILAENSEIDMDSSDGFMGDG